LAARDAGRLLLLRRRHDLGEAQARLGFGLLRDAPGDLDARRLRELAVNARHALDLSLCREALVETLGAEIALEIGPGSQLATPPGLASIHRLGIVARD